MFYGIRLVFEIEVGEGYVIEGGVSVGRFYFAFFFFLFCELSFWWEMIIEVLKKFGNLRIWGFCVLFRRRSFRL